MKRLFNLSWVFMLLSVLAVGGGTAVLPQMQHTTVDTFHWLTDAQFREIYSIGQVAPGPNMMMVLLIGYRLAGAAGAVIVGLSFFVPDFIIALTANRLWIRFHDSPWRLAVQRGLAPVAIGLMASGTYAIARLSIMNAASLAIAAVAFGILYWRHVPPALLVIAAGIAYVFLPH